MGVTRGRVESQPNLITFIPEFEKSSRDKMQMHSTHDVQSFIPVKWRDELLLIPEKEVGEFADYVAGLGDFNGLNGFDPDDMAGSYFFSKRAGKDTPRAEFPVLPREYQHLMKQPVTGSVTRVIRRQVERNYSYEFASRIISFTQEHEIAALYSIVVNIGTAQGAKKGLLLRVSEPDLGETLRLVDVGETSSKAVLVRDIQEGKETYYDNEAGKELNCPSPAAGWKVTTAPR
jgi:hypothetical protein